LLQWNTATVPNGTYSLRSVATEPGHPTGVSAGVNVTVNNALPTTAVVLPAGNATVSGTQALDATASPAVVSVVYVLFGGPSNLTYDIIALGSPTIYGWLAQWNTTTVPNGTYKLETVVSTSGGLPGTSPQITITVEN
jgi:hypothetical protein